MNRNHFFLYSTAILLALSLITLKAKSVVVCLVRHGQTEPNRLHIMQGSHNAPINDMGKKEIQELANKLDLTPFAAYYSSTLKRAIQSAQILTRKRPLPIHKDARIRERTYGSWEGKPDFLYALALPQEKRGVEKSSEMKQRIFSFLDDTLNKYDGKKVLVVTHGGVINTILQTIIPHAWKMFNIPNASLTCICYKNGRWQLSPAEGINSPYIHQNLVPSQSFTPLSYNNHLLYQPYYS